jgi:cytochrome subunit of sulfide dehydrogenase
MIRTVAVFADALLTPAGVFACAMLLAAPARAQAVDPRLASLVCAGCHGPAGHSPGDIPSLNGRTAAALAADLRAYRTDQRPSTVMGRVAKGYSDADIDGIARQIATDWK